MTKQEIIEKWFESLPNTSIDIRDTGMGAEWREALKNSKHFIKEISFATFSNDPAIVAAIFELGYCLRKIEEEFKTLPNQIN